MNGRDGKVGTEMTRVIPWLLEATRFVKIGSYTLPHIKRGA